MIDISKASSINRKTVLGKILRYPFKLITPNAQMYILSGILIGKRWINESHNRSIWLGMYERNQTKLFVKMAKNKEIFWDLGSHAGYYSLLFSTISPKGKVIAFEPLPQNIENFKRHMALNKISNFKLYEAAASNKNGFLMFHTGKSSVAGRLSSNGNLKVKVLKLSELVSKKELEIPDIIKMDIEGAEIDVLIDLRDIIIQHKPILFISTHGNRVHEACVELLSGIKATLVPLDTNSLITARELMVQW